MAKVKFKSEVELGETYVDTITGMKGKATACTFYLHACERVTLEFLKDGELKYESFDAPRLKKFGTEKPLATTRTGGPGGREAAQNKVADRR